MEHVTKKDSSRKASKQSEECLGRLRNTREAKPKRATGLREFGKEENERTRNKPVESASKTVRQTNKTLNAQRGRENPRKKSRPLDKDRAN